MTFRSWTTRAICLFICSLAPHAGSAETAIIATSANFAEVMETLQSDFEANSGHQLTLVTGSTGKLYAQLVNGAPFDALLAADQIRPQLLIESGFAVPKSRFTYATGLLVLWSADENRIGIEGKEALQQDFRHLAIANPDLAPYGAAAIKALHGLEMFELVQDRIVMGENIGQAHALVTSGNAELGIVALAYAISPRNLDAGSYWRIPPDLYAPVHQDAVLLRRAENNLAAIEFLNFLQSERVKTIIREFGYEVE